jgi:hypothetical protein
MNSVYTFVARKPDASGASRGAAVTEPSMPPSAESVAVPVTPDDTVYHRTDLEGQHNAVEPSAGVDDQMLENSYRRIVATCTSSATLSGKLVAREFDETSIASSSDSSVVSLSKPIMPFGGTCYNSSNSFASSSNLHVNGKGQQPMSLELALSMERTLFSALNNAWLLTLGGVGLMSVGVGAATRIGAVVIAGGIVCALTAFITHWMRFRSLLQSTSFRPNSSLVFVSLFFLLTIATLVLELYYGIQYPYLERAQEVAMSSVREVAFIPPNP